MRGIGRAIALRFASDGLDVALIDIPRSASQLPAEEVAAGWRGIESVSEEIAKLGRRAVAIYADITDPAQVEQAVNKTVSELGRIDVLVNNARAILGRDKVPVVDLETAEWDRVMAVNTRGVFLCAQAVARHIIGRKSAGQILNMSSASGKRGRAGQAAYCASKFAINGFTQSLALELAPHGITVNAICPGVVDTGRFNANENLAAETAGVSLEEYARKRFEERSQKIPLGRVAVAGDVANMAAFLISSQGDYITGQAINVDGGVNFN
jgi:3-oxoacyl-[acyl-carrier protein] reductase/meso-butanediol dehydrogenase/(S,S)-butanediol dehydrogenase/diacetyl reductase